MNKKLLFSLLASAMCGLGFSQTFDGIPTGEGYYINKLIASPPTVYDDGNGGLTTDDADGVNPVVTNELTLEYYEFRGEPGAVVPENLYFINVEGDGESGKTDMGKVDEAIKLGDGTRTFGTSGMLVIVSNYTDEATNVVTTNPYVSSLMSSGATVITVELTGDNVTGTSSSNVSTKVPDIGYDGNMEDASTTYMLVQSGTEAAPVSPKGHDLDSDNDGVIDAVGTHTSWILHDSVSYLDIDDPNDGTDQGEFGYGQVVFARGYDAANDTNMDGLDDNFKITTSAVIIPQGTSNVSFLLRQGYKTGDGVNDWIGAANSTSVLPNWKFTTTDSKVSPDYFGGYFLGTDFPYGGINLVEPNAWNGSTDNDWATETNWDLGIVPVVGSEVEIMSGTPVISGMTAADAYDVTVDSGASLTIEAGGSLMVDGTVTGDITYNVNVPDANWYFYGTPVSGEMYDDTWISANNIATGTVAANRGIAGYDRATSSWDYFQGGAAAETFGAGAGYAFKANAMGAYSFTGSYASLPIATAITQVGENNWNLLGNTTTGYLDVAAYIAENAANISDEYEALYTYDGTDYVMVTSGELAPGTAYFINAEVASGTVSLTESVIGHQGVSSGKSSEAVIDLKVSNGSLSKNAIITFNDATTLGLDKGKDLGLFNGIDSDLSVYTELVTDNNGVAFAVQTLPESDATVIPVGIIAAAGEELEISANALNLPETIGVYLEDRISNTVTDLSESSYKVTLEEGVTGVGRFYIHTTSAKSLSTDTIDALAGVAIYKSSINEITISGLSSMAKVDVYSVLGKQVLSTEVEAQTTRLGLTSVGAGVYIVKLQSDLGTLTKKIILE